MPLARSGHFAALAAVVALLFSGCGDDTTAGPPPLPTVSPAPTVGAFTKSPEPEPAPETAKEFIRRFVKLQNDMQRTGETAEYLAESASCTTCVGFAEQVETIYAAGGFIDTEGWRIIKFYAVGGTKRRPTIDAVVISRPTTYAKRLGARTQSLPGGRLKERFELTRDGSDWSLLENSEVSS